MLKYLVIAAGLLTISSSAQAVLIDFKALANGSLGESAWNSLMFKADGSHAASISDAFLEITGTNGDDSYAYLDSGNAGLGVCGTLSVSAIADEANSGSRTNLCNPSSDDNVTYHNGVSETLHFVFDAAVIIEGIWLNNNHDGDRSLLGDSVLVGVDGASNPPTTLTNGGHMMDSLLSMGLVLGAGYSFDVGFHPNPTCHNGGSYNNCEFYISAIEFSTVPEPATFVLLSLGLVGMGVVRHRQK